MFERFIYIVTCLTFGIFFSKEDAIVVSVG